MEKSKFRSEQILRLEKFFASKESKVEENLLLDLLKENEMVKNVHSIGISLDDDFSISAKKLIGVLRDLGKDVYLARVEQNKLPEFVYWPETLKIPNNSVELMVYNPTTTSNRLDLIILSGLSFSLKGHYRIGIGDGNFDHFLNRYQTKTLGLAFSPMIYQQPEWDISMLDVPVDEILSI